MSKGTRKKKKRSRVAESYLPSAFGWERDFFGYSCSGMDRLAWWAAGFGGQLADKKGGSYQPFFWTDVDLAQIWAQARRVATSNGLGVGVVETLQDFVVGTGWQYEAQPARGLEQDAQAVQLAREVNAVVAEFRDLNSWHLYEAEAVWKFVVEGECFQRFFPQPDGTCLVRPVEPEQVRQPFDQPQDEWGFGIRTDARDVCQPLAYALHYDPDSAADCEYVEARWINHGKANVPLVVKRGLSDFFSSHEAFFEVGRLLRNMRICAAVQAAIPWWEQMPAGTTQAGIDAVIASRKNLNHPPEIARPDTGRIPRFETYEPGTVKILPAGREVVAGPLANNTTNHVAVAQAALRALGVRWAMPEFMISGDASNNNYASIFVAGSPFVRRIERYQATRYRPFFLRSMWTAVRIAQEAGRFGSIDFSVLMRLVDLHATPPTVAISDRSAEAAQDLADLRAGVVSKQIVRAKRGYDDAKVRADLAVEPAAPAI